MIASDSEISLVYRKMLDRKVDVEDVQWIAKLSPESLLWIDEEIAEEALDRFDSISDPRSVQDRLSNIKKKIGKEYPNLQKEFDSLVEFIGEDRDGITYAKEWLVLRRSQTEIKIHPKSYAIAIAVRDNPGIFLDGIQARLGWSSTSGSITARNYIYDLLAYGIVSWSNKGLYITDLFKVSIADKNAERAQ